MNEKYKEPRWYCPTPGRLLIALLTVEIVLFISEQFQWFAFNLHKNWTVLIAMVMVGAAGGGYLLWWSLSLIFRWRFQFDLRALLTLVIVVALPCSWFAARMQQARQQRQVVERIVAAGGQVHYLNGFAVAKSIPPQRIIPESLTLSSVLGADFLSNPDMVVMGSSTVDADLADLKRLSNVNLLSLRNTRISDTGLAQLRVQVHLEYLDLAGTEITDTGLAHLEELTQLRFLDLADTKTTDAGLMHLHELLCLEALWLANTRITDAGLVHLEGLKNLVELDLTGTEVTSSAKESFWLKLWGVQNH
ncbi:MAG: hypothetical protein JW818_08535 [Pirellulales bacterium]|nr:hypothetical protein [Pirellulales bacterium]